MVVTKSDEDSMKRETMFDGSDLISKTKVFFQCMWQASSGYKLKKTIV